MAAPRPLTFPSTSPSTAMSRKRTADDMEQETDSATGLIQLSRSGDIIFEVGMGEEQRRIQVSSALLTMFSTAFVAPLGPHFREGRNLGDAQNPATKPLPEDEPEAMSDLFRLLHHVPVPALATGRDAKRIFAFARAADKWCCSEILGLQAQGMLLAARLRLKEKFGRYEFHLLQLIAASYLFNQDQLFASLVGMLRLSSKESFLDLCIKMDDATLPEHFYRP
ncbi:hypothetical protein M409DRAFT_55490 [Zasmidium cellare ATCC 36951]|uniref:BTB domain-containing protein n=1 Tax=Zasmidium cellare ATCC 36951 TaxID=1080233 RepID=A0A6A6CIR8_ZASCE|nr:uncharacterized protein M409DRAFT_55490 [Zasmidium cellare ATCC 36951]KAF2165589.1 hypothetical protein M409DRAFT_55490 [Zasmidium cellare ATCC 36951]